MLAGFGLLVTLCNTQTFAAVDDARTQYRKGIQDFVNGRVKESVEAFDRAIELDSTYADILWQRGLSLFYCDRFDEASSKIFLLLRADGELIFVNTQSNLNEMYASIQETPKKLSGG